MRRYWEYWSQQIQWWCSRGLEWWATRLTALYIGGAILIVGSRFDELIVLRLNEIGDLFAGLFGPIAFLWLVLGYIQQGRELKLSSEALQLQAKELKNAVVQQCEMVAAQKASLLNYERSLEPLLHLDVEDAGWVDEDFYVRLALSNTGSYCESVSLSLIGSDSKVKKINADPLVNGASTIVGFNGVDEWEDFNVVVEYRKISGTTNSQSFSATHHQERGYGSSYIVRKNPFAN